MDTGGFSLGTMTSRWQESGLRWLWIAVLVAAFDQASKLWVDSVLALYQSIELAPSLNVTLIHNTGAAFSFLSEASGWQRWFFVALALAVGAGILVWLRRLDCRNRLPSIGLALILGGALGNVIDRVQHGHVIDFIDVYYGRWHWPAFNVADSAITVGAVLMVFDALVGTRKGDV